MIKHRIGYRPLGDFPIKRDKDGNRICVNCGKIITKKYQRKYCNTNCYNEFEEKNYHSALRLRLMAETNFTCQKCGKQPESRNDLILDHIIPIALGGAEFDKNNLQILCIKCNKIKTSEDITKIAKIRRKEKQSNYDIDLLPIKFNRQEELKFIEGQENMVIIRINKKDLLLFTEMASGYKEHLESVGLKFEDDLTALVKKIYKQSGKEFVSENWERDKK